MVKFEHWYILTNKILTKKQQWSENGSDMNDFYYLEFVLNQCHGNTFYQCESDSRTTIQELWKNATEI